MKINRIMLMLFIVALVSTSRISAYAGTINVDVNDGSCVTGSGQPDPYGVGVVYCSIQDAIDDAVDGDTIIINSGLYDENLDINVKVSIEGAGSGTNSSVDTIIDPSGGLYGMYIHQPVNLKDLRVTGAPSHGIRVEPIVAPLIFNNVTWENIASSANGGRGVELHNGTQITNMAVTNCEFVNNTAQGIRASSGTPA